MEPISPSIDTNNYIRALQFTEKWEGIFSNDKFDPGGKTKYGISEKGTGVVDGKVDGKAIEDLTREDAANYYYKNYWLQAGCQNLDTASSIVMFDSSVNCGVGRAKEWLKQSEGDLKRYIEIRRMYYYAIAEKNTKLQRYIKGWLNRLNDLSKLVVILTSTS